MIHLCEYCAMHGAEDDGYCSDVCRRSMELFRAATSLVRDVNDGKGVSMRRLARALDALGRSE